MEVSIAQDIKFDRSFEEIKKMVDCKALHEIYADRVYLYKSEQIGQKRVYTPVTEHRFKL